MGSKTKTVVAIVTCIIAIAGAVLFMEDRSNAKNTKIVTSFDSKIVTVKADLEKDAVNTFEMQRKIMKEQLKGIEQNNSMKRLEDLRTFRLLLRGDLERDPKNQELQEQLSRIIRSIRRLESELF